MNLPKISTPEFECVLPSSGETVKYRPFLVREEKVLYIALESKDEREIHNAIINILKSCVIGVNVEKLPFFDVELLFLRIRSKSVGELVEVEKRMDSCGKEGMEKCDSTGKITLNLNDVSVVGEIPDTKVIFDNGIGMKFRFPDLSLLAKNSGDGDSIEKILDLIVDCTVMVFDADNVYEEFTKNELKEWIQSLSQSQFSKMMDFFNGMPRVKHDVTYQCSKCGKEETVTLEGLENFFS